MPEIKATPGREIKFRAWDGTRMIYNTTPYAKREGKILCIGKSGYNWYRLTSVETSVDCEAEAIMQYAGLPDKNKQDVYEGDICDTHTRFGKGVVIFESGIYKVNGISICTFHELEVIGNVHDNPGLLE